eukprot:6984896-Alexandrium_andersonii.AAC.1
MAARLTVALGLGGSRPPSWCDPGRPRRRVRPRPRRSPSRGELAVGHDRHAGGIPLGARGAPRPEGRGRKPRPPLRRAAIGPAPARGPR